VVERPGVVHGPEEAFVGRATVREFLKVEFAEDDGSSGFESADDFGVIGGNAVLIDAIGGGGANSGRVDVVFDRDGNAVERTAPFAAMQLSFHLPRAGQGLLPTNGNEFIHRSVVTLDPLETCLRGVRG
jgi:hypothetical protein